jgi:hypothetical protein
LPPALAIELAYEGAQWLHHQGFNARAAWVLAGFLFALYLALAESFV